VLFATTDIPGVVLVTPERLGDERGYFARTWCQDEFAAHGLNPRVVQRNVSYNRAAATLRGMHYQRAPHGEAKLVACISGAIYDVAIDLRPDSPSFRRWFAAELRADDGAMLYIAEGCAHGFVTLEPDTTVEYLMSAGYVAAAAAGVRWDDPAFGISWPRQPRVISARDRVWPDFSPGTSD
jgi:dTDP-4-dehydrorhamnose 3,5-epimerase